MVEDATFGPENIGSTWDHSDAVNPAFVDARKSSAL
jgi:hypothetical protein